MARVQSGLHHPVSVYAKQVVCGKLHDMCCEYEIAACKRHLDDLKRQGDPDFPYVFDTTRADRIIRWFGQCIQVRGVEAGQPITPQPWQIFDQGCLYGWVHKDTGARRFNKTYNKRARGNVKSTEVSCKALYHMCGDAIYPPYHPELAKFEQEPEVECAAVDRGQAMRVFGDAKKIAQASPKIAKRLIIPRSNPVVHKTLGGFMRALSRDTKNKDSGAPSYFVVDEFHAHPTREIYDIGFSGFGKRPQPLLDVITTAGDDAGSKPCYEEEEYAKRVALGEARDDRYFVMIRELPADADPHDKSLWCLPNPLLRYPNEYSSYLLGQIEAEYTTAYESGNATLIRDWLSRRMCQWQAASVNSYLTEPQLKMAKEAMVSPEIFLQLTDMLPCYAGYDLGKRIDLSGVGAVWELPNGRWAVKATGMIPEAAAQTHEHTDRVPYKSWAKDGYVILTPGDVTDNSYVDNWITKIESCNPVRHTGYDGHNATDLAIKMNQDRNRDDFCVEVSQTCAGQNLACKKFRELLLEGKLIIEYSPLLLWCLSNAIEIQNNYGDIKLSKKHKDDSQRIDPLAAVMDALAVALVQQDKPDLSARIGSGDWSM